MKRYTFPLADWKGAFGTYEASMGTKGSSTTGLYGLGQAQLKTEGKPVIYNAFGNPLYSPRRLEPDFTLDEILQAQEDIAKLSK